jgi:ArsR family transcriptional regulator
MLKAGMTDCKPARTVLTSFADVARAIAHEHRLELLEHLAQSERSVEALATLGGLSVANTSQHLQHLRRAGLVNTRRDGKRVYYALSNECEVVQLVTALRRVAERTALALAGVVRSYFDKRDDLEPVTRAELMRRVKEEAVTILDVRPVEEFASGHVPGATNIPQAELEKRLNELPDGSLIVAYCRGPYCVMSFEAVAALRSHGFKALRLEDGYPEWKAAGLPVEAIAKQ